MQELRGKVTAAISASPVDFTRRCELAVYAQTGAPKHPPLTVLNVEGGVPQSGATVVVINPGSNFAVGPGGVAMTMAPPPPPYYPAQQQQAYPQQQQQQAYPPPAYPPSDGVDKGSIQ